MSELLESAIVLHGDAADEELLIEENIDSADVFAAMTNAEEANILSAMLAKRLGAHKVIALINKPSYTELVESSSSSDTLRARRGSRSITFTWLCFSSVRAS